MARHILEGRGHPVFYWGATYGGTLEPHLLAPVFGLFGATPEAFRGFYVALWAAFWAGTAAFAARFFGRGAGLLAAAYLAIPPFFLPYKILTSDGAYASVALLGLAVLWLATEADARLEAGRPAGAPLALLGLAAGVGIWVTPVTLPVVAVAGLWLLARPGRRPDFAALAACGAGALLGAAPSLVWNLRHAGRSAPGSRDVAGVGRGPPLEPGTVLRRVAARSPRRRAAELLGRHGALVLRRVRRRSRRRRPPARARPRRRAARPPAPSASRRPRRARRGDDPRRAARAARAPLHGRGLRGVRPAPRRRRGRRRARSPAGRRGRGFRAPPRERPVGRGEGPPAHRGRATTRRSRALSSLCSGRSGTRGSRASTPTTGPPTA